MQRKTREICIQVLGPKLGPLWIFHIDLQRFTPEESLTEQL